MRIRELRLTRYGKFTDRVLACPAPTKISISSLVPTSERQNPPCARLLETGCTVSSPHPVGISSPHAGAPIGWRPASAGS